VGVRPDAARDVLTFLQLFSCPASNSCSGCSATMRFHSCTILVVEPQQCSCGEQLQPR